MIVRRPERQSDQAKAAGVGKSSTNPFNDAVLRGVRMVCPAPPPAPALRPASHRTGSARPDVYAGGRPAPPQATRCARTRSRSRREGPRAVRRRSTRSDPDDDRRRHRDPRSSRGYDPRAQAWHHRARIAPDAPCGPSRAASTRCARSSPGTNRIPVSAARFSIGGRPPFGRGRGGSRSGAISSQRSSGRSGLAMPNQR